MEALLFYTIHTVQQVNPKLTDEMRNRICKYLIRFSFVSIIPLIFLTPILWSFINETKPLSFKGKLTKQYKDIAYLSNDDGETVEEKCISLILNDSLKFILLENLAHKMHPNRLKRNDSLVVEYRILTRNSYELSGLVEDITYSRDNEDYLESRMPYLSIEKLSTKEVVLVKRSKRFYYVLFLVFSISLVLFILTCINAVKKVLN